MEALDLAREIVHAVEDKKAESILLLDLRPDTVIADFFVICTGTSDRQIRALAENVRETIKTRFGKLPYSTEGEHTSGWMLLDYGDVIVHIFGESQREFYNLESFWRQANVLVSIQ